MPVHVEFRGGKRPWKIVGPDGKVEGSSLTKKDAESSARARNASKHGWEPTGKKS